MNFQTLICEVGIWSDYNFDSQKGANAFAPFVGMVEETGEIAVAFDDILMRNFDVKSGKQLVDDMIDGHVDRLIYFADFCYRLGISCSNSLEEVTISDQCNYLLPDAHGIQLAKLAHRFLKYHQGIRNATRLPLIEQVRATLESFVDCYYGDIELVTCAGIVGDLSLDLPLPNLPAAVNKVWSVVKLRDWKKNPSNANKIAEDIAGIVRL
jgi:hypothetical protein